MSPITNPEVAPARPSAPLRRISAAQRRHPAGGRPAVSQPAGGDPADEQPSNRRPVVRRGGSASVRARRLRVGLLGLVVAVVAAACQPVWPVQVPYLTPADDAAAWLSADYQANGASYGAGQLADLISAYAATGADQALAQEPWADLVVATPAYLQPSPGNVNAGAAGKVILAAHTMRANPADIGGVDVEALLRGTLVTSGPDEGRFAGASVFNQSLAVLALAPTAGKVPPSAAQWLADRQCPDGSFTWGACGSGSVDTTALATQALRAAGGQPDAVVAATAWLLDQQDVGGGFGSTPNANATGLAASTLRWNSHPGPANDAAAFMTTLQHPGNAGAIAWTATNDGSLFFATVQGVLAFGAGPLHQLRFPAVVGEPCEGDEGVTVVVDTARFDNTISVTCADGPQASGLAALETVGVDVGFVPGTNAVCTLDGFPTEGYPECWFSGFWSYWHADDGATTWSMAMTGAGSRVPPLGSVEGWRYEPDYANHMAVPPGIAPNP